MSPKTHGTLASGVTFVESVGLTSTWLRLPLLDPVLAALEATLRAKSFLRFPASMAAVAA